MFGTNFYHSSTRNLVVAFGNMFNNITLVRKRTDGSEYERIKVPIEYGPKQKWWVVRQEDPANLKTVRMILPRISYEIVNLSYDNSRQLIPVQKVVSTVAGDYYVNYVGTPYTHTFELNIIAQNADDGFQIVEQILPFFAPTQTVAVNTLPLIAQVDDIPITLVSIQKNDDYEGSFERLRTQTWTLLFNVRSFFYGPIAEAKLIKKAIVDIHAVKGSGPITASEVTHTPRHARIVTQPNPADVEPEDDYGFTISITEYNDNKKYDPVTGLDVPAGPPVTIKAGVQSIQITLNSPTVTTS